VKSLETLAKVVGDRLDRVDAYDACDDLLASAEDAADIFGYNRALDWTLEPLAKTNEIYVDFR